MRSALAASSFLAVAVFFAPDDSAWLTGEQLLATGGVR